MPYIPLLGGSRFSVFALPISFMACNLNCCVGLVGSSSSVVLLAVSVSDVEKFQSHLFRLGATCTDFSPSHTHTLCIAHFHCTGSIAEACCSLTAVQNVHQLITNSNSLLMLQHLYSRLVSNFAAFPHCFCSSRIFSASAYQ